jgi:biopolymer transport protein TolQ
MTVTQDLSFVSMISNASVLVQLVMLLLALVSAMSWTYIFRKMFAIRNATTQTTEFESAFWSGANLNTLYEEATSSRRQRSGQSGALERIFEAGMEEYRKARLTFAGKDSKDNSALLDGARRAMRAAYQREMDALESHLAFLASVGSVSPYIGLFGTVWGIMNAFRGLSNVQQATLASVAPGIAEALVATAIGLFAAIPAVVAYNRYSHDIDRLAIRFESFIEEFSNILNRQAR